MASVSRDRARDYYDGFSVATGTRDWLGTNARHEQLKLLIGELVEGRRALRILDVGCAVGIMTDHLRRYGEVTGVDFSSAAIDAARTFTARRFGRPPTFLVGSLEAVPAGARFDLITLFDVLEHLERGERPEFFANLRTRLAGDGLLIASTPYPAFTQHRRDIGDDTLQIVDEQIELPDVLQEAADADLQLLRYQAYDVFAGSPEYQIMLFTTARLPGGPPALRSRTLERRMAWRRSRLGSQMLRVARAARLAAAGQPAAKTMLAGRAPKVRS